MDQQSNPPGQDVNTLDNLLNDFNKDVNLPEESPGKDGMPSYYTETNMTQGPKPQEFDDTVTQRKVEEYRPPMESIVEQSQEFNGTNTGKELKMTQGTFPDDFE